MDIITLICCGIIIILLIVVLIRSNRQGMDSGIEEISELKKQTEIMAIKIKFLWIRLCGRAKLW